MYPTEDTVIVSFSKAGMLKKPFASVIVPRRSRFRKTVAKGRGDSESPVTTMPLICTTFALGVAVVSEGVDCECPNAESNKAKRNSAVDFWRIGMDSKVRKLLMDLGLQTLIRLSSFEF
jgi:hypothetical protein